VSRRANPVLLYLTNRAPALGTLICHTLRKAGFVVDRADDPGEVRVHERMDRADLVILDLESNDVETLADRIRHRAVIVLAEDCYETLLARQKGWAVIEKPFAMGELRRLCVIHTAQSSATEWRPRSEYPKKTSQFMARLSVSLQHCRFCDEQCRGPRDCPVTVSICESLETEGGGAEVPNDGEWQWLQGPRQDLIPIPGCPA
jgi:DNA-binding response OmpR family regulator